MAKKTYQKGKPSLQNDNICESKTSTTVLDDWSLVDVAQPPP